MGLHHVGGGRGVGWGGRLEPCPPHHWMCSYTNVCNCRFFSQLDIAKQAYYHRILEICLNLQECVLLSLTSNLASPFRKT